MSDRINEIDKAFPPSLFRFNLKIHEGEVDTAEKLKKFIDNTNDGLEALRGQVDRLSKGQDDAWEREKLGLSNTNPVETIPVEKWTKLIHHIMHGETGEINKLGGFQGDIEKSLATTPLVNDSTTGSYLIPNQYSREIVRLADGLSELKPKCRRLPATTRLCYYPKADAEVTLTKVSSDSTELTESNPTFSQEDLEIFTFATIIGVTESFMEDEISGFGEYFRDLIVDAYTSCFETYALTNATYGICEDSNVQGVETSGTTGDSIDFDVLWAAVEALDTKAKRRNAHWIMHPTMLDRISKQQDGVGSFFYKVNIIEGRLPRLLGFPIILSDVMTAAASCTASSRMAVLMDPRSIVWGDRIGMEISYFNQTIQTARFQENIFRARCRMGFDQALPENAVVITAAAN